VPYPGHIAGLHSWNDAKEKRCMKMQNLHYQKILVIEDDFFSANYIVRKLEQHGAIVLGPFGWIDDVLSFLKENIRSIDAALLDLDLHGEESYPIADLLIQHSVPFMFITGYGHSTIRQAYLSHPRIEKPIQEAPMLRGLSQIFAGTSCKSSTAAES
jgi:response regulator RpfG family c-di-GMP phosphodiesterase